MRRCFVIPVLALVALVGLSGQDKPTVFDRYPQAIGGYANVLGVYGLSYQQWGGQWGWQVAGGGSYGLYDPESFDYSLQLGLQYRLYEEDFADWLSGSLYLIGLAGHTGSRVMAYDDLGGSSGLGPYKPAIIGGLGVGFETVLFRHFSTELQLLYFGRFLSDPAIQFAAGFGFRYRF